MDFQRLLSKQIKLSYSYKQHFLSLAGKAKAPKSPKSGIGRIFSGRRKNYVQQPPKITGPAETAIIASQVQMSDEDRKNLMLKVKHGDITQEEALNNFLRYTHGERNLIFFIQLKDFGHVYCHFLFRFPVGG